MESEYISTLYSISIALTESNLMLLNRISNLEARINQINIVPQFNVYPSTMGHNINYYPATNGR